MESAEAGLIDLIVQEDVIQALVLSLILIDARQIVHGKCTVLDQYTIQWLYWYTSSN